MKISREQLEKQKQEILRGRDWWEPRIPDDQVDSVAQVVLLNQQGQSIPPELQPAEKLRQSLRRRSFC